jgi:hypothetical protein
MLEGIDHRTKWMRRYKDLIAAHHSDLGDDHMNGLLSEGQKGLIRRCAMLEIQLSMYDARFAAADGAASAADLDAYGRAASHLRRILESLSLHTGRKPRDVNTLEHEALRLYEKELRQ